jgi:peptide/nickel transport system permease protein
MRAVVRKLSLQAMKLLATVLLGGLLSATLVRLAPGYGLEEGELDSRLSAQSRRALYESRVEAGGLGPFYLLYLNRLLHGDLGTSLALHEPVRQVLRERFPETLISVGIGLAFAWSIGLGLATAGIVTRWACVELGASLLATLMLCIPAAVLALLFVMARAPGRLAIGLIVFPKVYQYARNLLGRTALLPHVLTAQAKGLGPVRVFLRHILPVAARPLFALGGVTACLAFAAAVPVEVLCDLPGIGQLAWKAALSRDLVLLVNLTILVTLITLLANSVSEWAPTRARGGDA